MLRINTPKDYGFDRPLFKLHTKGSCWKYTLDIWKLRIVFYRRPNLPKHDYWGRKIRCINFNWG